MEQADKLKRCAMRYKLKKYFSDKNSQFKQTFHNTWQEYYKFCSNGDSYTRRWDFQLSNETFNSFIDDISENGQFPQFYSYIKNILEI